jgi:hypothetical protein
MQIQTNNANFININILGNIGDVIVSLLAVGVLDLSSKKQILFSLFNLHKLKWFLSRASIY